MSSFIFAFNSLMPIILLIGFGFLLYKFNFLNDNFVNIGNKLVFKFLIPIYLFMKIYNIEDFKVINFKFIFYSLDLLFVLFILGILISSFFIKDNRKKGVVIQSAFRPNYGVLGIPLAMELGNNNSIVIVSLLAAFLIPFANTLAVISLNYYSNKKDKNNIKIALLNIIKNPIILGVVFGLIFLLFKTKFKLDLENNFIIIYKTLDNIQKITSPFALIILGASYKFELVKENKKELVVAVFLRNILSPLLVIGLTIILYNYGILDYGKDYMPALMALSCTPIAVSSFSLAKGMDMDDKLASLIVVWTSLFSIFSIFIVTFLLRLFNFL